MTLLTKSNKSAETEVFLSLVKDVALDLPKIVTNPSPESIVKLLQKYSNVFVTIPDKIFFIKLNWFFDDWEHLKLSDKDKAMMKKRINNQEYKEEFSFQLLDAINKAYGKRQIHFIVNCLIYALTYEENIWREEFYRVVFIILNTDVYSLDFLVEQLDSVSREDNNKCCYNEKVPGLFSSGLVTIATFETSLTAGPSEQKFFFTPLAYKVYEYIKDR